MQYEVPLPGRQVAMVLDLNKCLGCHTCTDRLQEAVEHDQGTDYAYWNNVETMPGKGYPGDSTPNRRAHRERRGASAAQRAGHRRRLRARLDVQPPAT